MKVHTLSIVTFSLRKLSRYTNDKEIWKAEVIYVPWYCSSYRVMDMLQAV